MEAASLREENEKLTEVIEDLNLQLLNQHVSRYILKGLNYSCYEKFLGLGPYRSNESWMHLLVKTIQKRRLKNDIKNFKKLIKIFECILSVFSII